MAGARTELFSRHQPGGVFTIEDVVEHPGAIFFVDSATGTDGAGYGDNPDAPLATIDYAIGLCTANKGDVIYVLPGHAESINAAGAIEADKAGISIIGLGNGENRAVITVGTSDDTSTVLVTAANVRLRNLILQPGNDGVDVLLDLNADGAIIEDCEFREDASNAYQVDNYIDVGGGANGADRTTIRRCKIVSVAAGAVSAINIAAVQDALRIEDCWIDGDFSAAGIESASIFTNALIARNYVSNRNSGNHAIEFSAAGTGLLVDNRLYGDTLGTILDPGSMKCLGNLETDAVDQAGVDSPRTSAGGLAADSITAAVIATGAFDADAIAADTILGADNANNAFASTLVAANADGSIIERLEFIQGTSIVARAVEKSDGAMLNGADDLFTITGGPVRAKIVGIVDTVIGAVVATGKLQITTTSPAGTVDISTAVNIENDAAGTSYTFIGATAVLTPTTAGAKILDPVTVEECEFLLPVGTVKFFGSAANTGVIKWYMTYMPMSPNSAVAAAA